MATDVAKHLVAAYESAAYELPAPWSHGRGGGAEDEEEDRECQAGPGCGVGDM